MKKIIGVCMIALAITSIAAAQDTTTKEMAGKYKFPAGSVIEEAIVTWENGVLTMRSTAGVSVLEKMKGDTFNVVSFSGICVFKRDDAKKITGVHVDASGYILDGEKEPVSQLNDDFVESAYITRNNTRLQEFSLYSKANPQRCLSFYN